MQNPAVLVVVDFIQRIDAAALFLPDISNA
jgi:hypothetical protein